MSVNVKPLDIQAEFAKLETPFVASSSSSSLSSKEVSESSPCVQKSSYGTQVHSFNKRGLSEATIILQRIRIEKSLLCEEIEELLEDPEFIDDTKGDFRIDRERAFETKLDLCKYFEETFGEEVLNSHRKDSGFWTWIAFAYYHTIIKTKKGATKLGADACWVYNPEYRLSRRHFFAGTINLYLDIKGASSEAKDMLFSGPIQEFSGFTDAITYKQEGSRMPALLQVAAWLYYDKGNPKCLKRGVVDQHKPGTIRQLLRVCAHFGQTRDFYDISDAPELWNILPDQFDAFKGNAHH